MTQALQKFTDLTLSDPLLRALADLNFEKPSQIQAEALPILLAEPTDFIGLAATGTGKTAAFSIPLLETIDPQLKKLQSLILCPTRELALQVAEQINLLGKYLNVRALPIYGGAGYREQIDGLKRGAQVVVGTPGRLIDHLNRKTIILDDLKTLVLDEADEMISMGFKDDLEAILKASPRENSKIWLFSATMQRDVRKVADTYLKDPKQVQVNKKEMLSSTIEQIYFNVREAEKPDVICKLIDAADSFYGLIFCQTKSLVSDLSHHLSQKGYQVDSLHGDKDQNARERTMTAFRNRRVNILICTDVASRGLDVKDITHVINYSIPRELDSYVHRIGRTARSGKSGLAFSLVTPANRSLIPRIEKMTNSRMKQGNIPSGRQILAKKVNHFLEDFHKQTAHDRASEFLGEELKKQLRNMTHEEIVSRFVAMNFPGSFDNLDAVSSKPMERQSPKKQDRDSRSKSYGKPQSKPYGKSYGKPRSESKPFAKPYEKKSDTKAYGRPEGESKSFAKPYGKPQSESKPYAKPYAKKPYGKSEPESKPYSQSKPTSSFKPKTQSSEPTRPYIVLKAPAFEAPKGNRAARRKHLQKAYAETAQPWVAQETKKKKFFGSQEKFKKR